MELKDRDLFIIGAGAFLTVLCLLFQWPFVIRIVLGLLVLVMSMIVGIGRFGTDKEPLEKYLGRRLGDLTKLKKYTYQDDQDLGESVASQGRVFGPPVPSKSSLVGDVSSALEKPIRSPSNSARSAPAIPNVALLGRSITFDCEEIGIYRLVTIWLIVVGIYFVYWLAKGGTEQIGQWIRTSFMLH